MIRFETDSHGRSYQIWQQDQMSSCGVAAVWMARCIAKQQSFAEDEWDLAIRLYRNAVNDAFAPLGVAPEGRMCLDPGAFQSDRSSMASSVANVGFTCDHLAAALRMDGLQVSMDLRRDPDVFRIADHLITRNRPAIALVRWKSAGGHFVVVGRCTKHAVSFLDPWDGRVNEQQNDGRYKARYPNSGRITVALYVSGR